jgi:hypothetical protein
MSYRLFLDDIRTPSERDSDMVIVRSYEEAVTYVETHGCPSFISFDHDLSFNHYSGLPTEEKTGYDFAKWLVKKDLDLSGKFIPEDFKFYVHSQNPVGAENIRSYLRMYFSIK